MYYHNVDEVFKIYLKGVGIDCVDNFDANFNSEEISPANVERQVRIITEFHKRTLGYTGNMNKRLENTTGKVIEQYKIYIKRLDKYLCKLNTKGCNNIFEEQILDLGKEYLKRAKRCIDTIYKNGYTELILRSMNRIEMCLGDTYFENLGKDTSIQIVNIKNCCYDLVEMDLAFFLSKVKKKKIKVNFHELINIFCTNEDLDDNSVLYILSLVSYPCEFMKCFNRYMEKSKDWTTEEYAKRLKKAIRLDGDSLI